MSTHTSQDIARAEALRAGFVARRIAEQYDAFVARRIAEQDALDAGDSPEGIIVACGGWDDLTADGRAFHLGQARDVIEAARRRDGEREAAHILHDHDLRADATGGVAATLDAESQAWRAFYATAGRKAYLAALDSLRKF